jgi:hypothetical protein
MLLVLFASALAAAQPGAETTASETWKAVAASAAASAPTGGDAPVEEVPAPSPPGTAEIPPANSSDALQQQPQSPGLESEPSDESSDVARYREDESEQLESEGELSTPFGMQLRKARRTLNSGEEAHGLLITAVEKNGPAAAVGLHAYSHGVHDALIGAATAGALVLWMVPGGQFAVACTPKTPPK